MKKVVLWVIIISIMFLLVFLLYEKNNTLEKKDTASTQNTFTEPNSEKSINLLNTKEWSLSSQEGLPPLVEQKRQAIALAAHNRDYKTLAGLVTKDFKYTLGNNDAGFENFITKENVETQAPLIFSLPYGKKEIFGDGILYYTWPSFEDKYASEWTSEDIRLMKTIATDKEIEEWREYGVYTGLRTSIKENGEWIYYLAGD